MPNANFTLKFYNSENIDIGLRPNLGPPYLGDLLLNSVSKGNKIRTFIQYPPHINNMLIQFLSSKIRSRFQ